MNHRLLLILPLVAATALGGCKMRGSGSSAREDTRDNGSCEQDLMIANQRVAQLQEQLDAARANMGNGPTIGEQGIAGGDIEGTERLANGGVALPDDFAFAKGSADLNEGGQKAIATLAQHLNEGTNSGKRIIVKGFTDDTPVARASTKEKFGDNWGLSAARSAAVVRALEKAGVSADRLQGAFRGQLDPRDHGKDESSKAKNRRVEIYLGG